MKTYDLIFQKQTCNEAEVEQFRSSVVLRHLNQTKLKLEFRKFDFKEQER